MKNAKLIRRLKVGIHAMLTRTMLLSMVLSVMSPIEKVFAQTVVQAPQINKNFSPIAIVPGEISVMKIEIYNPNTYGLTNVSFTDDMTSIRLGQSYKVGLEIADPPGVVNTWGGNVTANAGDTALSLSGGSVPAAASATDFGICSIEVNVTSTVQGNLYNYIPVGALIATGEGNVSLTNTSYVEESINVYTVQPPALSKSFAPSTVWVGQTSQLTITIQNPTGAPYTQTNLSDLMPGTVLQIVAGTAATTCTETGVSSSDSTLITTTAPRTVSLIGGYVPAGNVVTPGTCTITVDVTAPLDAADASYEDTGVDYGNAMSAGVPADSSPTGVECDANGSATTTTTYCYYEGPTTTYPRGRIVWVGNLGPDLGATTPAQAANDIAISFNVRINSGVTNIQNTATIDADLNGDGDVDDSGEQVVAEASKGWRAAEELPDTGFAPGKVTRLPEQPLNKAYSNLDGLVLEIPGLGVVTDIVTVPLLAGDWDVTWLGENAGYLIGSAYPTWNGNTVITAHNWSAFNQPGPFKNLQQLGYGDQIKIHAFGLTYIYEVRESKLVTGSNLKMAFEHEELDWVTLMTCEGYDQFNDCYVFRRLVRAILVDVVE